MHLAVPPLMVSAAVLRADGIYAAGPSRRQGSQGRIKITKRIMIHFEDMLEACSDFVVESILRSPLCNPQCMRFGLRRTRSA